MIEYDKETFDDYFYYDETSPSKLRWKVNRGRKIKADSVAGYLDKSNTHKYWYVALNNKRYRVHRIILSLFGKNIIDMQVDHIDGDTSNNTITNLRIADAGINSKNRGKRSDNKSGYTGVYKCNHTNRYVVQWTNTDGKLCRKYFSLKKHSETDALELAISYRDSKISEMSEYTTRHGF